jgi:hypothetical protein
MRPNRRILPAIEFMSRKASGPDSGRIGFGAEDQGTRYPGQQAKRRRRSLGID